MTLLAGYDRYIKFCMNVGALGFCLSPRIITAAWGQPPLLSSGLVPTQSIPSSPRSGGLSSQYAVDPRFEPVESLDQEDTPTCFAHSARFLLQYLVNSQSLSSSATAPSLAVLDVLGQGSEFELTHQGSPFKLLQRLKNHSLWVNQDLDIQAVWQFNQDYFKTYLNHPEKPLPEIVAQTLPLALQEQLPHWQEVLAARGLSQEGEDDLFQDAFKVPYRFLNAVVSAARVRLPAYNLHVFDPNSASLRDLSPDLPPSTPQEDVLIAILRTWFRSHGHQAVPLSISFCSNPRQGSGACGLHAINLVEMRTQCEMDGTCADAFRIRNSWGVYSEGWVEAQPLARAILDAQIPIAYLEPCHSAAQDSVRAADTEVCALEILGLHFGTQNPTPTGASSHKYLASHPLHYLAMSRDEEQFFQQANQLKTEGRLTSELNKKLAHGKTLGHLAVEDRSLKILEWLAANHPDVLKQDGDGIGNSAHLAVFLGHFGTIRTLMSSLPEIYTTQDSEGFYPADLAASSGNEPLLLELFKFNPILLTIKNARNESPLDSLKRQNRLAYRRVKAVVRPRTSLISRWYRWWRN